MRKLNTIAVFCSSSNQARESFKRDAFCLGECIARAHYRLMYGDGGIGLMASIADGALSQGGEVVGVIPRFMVDQGWNNPKSTLTIVTRTMHERKARIFRTANALVALPGGIGTFDELCESLTWKQLGIITCPIVILNSEGYFDPFLKCIDQMVDEHLMRSIHRDMFCVVKRPEEVIPAIENAPEWDPNTRRLAAI